MPINDMEWGEWNKKTDCLIRRNSPSILALLLYARGGIHIEPLTILDGTFLKIKLT